MRKLALIAVIGLAAQLVDGALGMAYGATSTSLLLSAGLAPAVVSATVHLAEIGTTAASGAAHWRFRNVDWRTVAIMAVPGAIGGFLGAVVLSSLSAGQICLTTCLNSATVTLRSPSSSKLLNIFLS